MFREEVIIDSATAAKALRETICAHLDPRYLFEAKGVLAETLDNVWRHNPSDRRPVHLAVTRRRFVLAHPSYKAAQNTAQHRRIEELVAEFEVTSPTLQLGCWLSGQYGAVFHDGWVYWHASRKGGAS